ncbi:hypothetical protein BD769DRAFT_1442371 [Suillus cothurnatus]|nr:hypothetical protein BD769DRAFT_1442371 [Suillus cothurnatus]
MIPSRRRRIWRGLSLGLGILGWMALYMHANRVRTELEMMDHMVLVVNDGALELSLVVVFVVGAAWITPTR